MQVACTYQEFVIPISRERAFKGMAVDVHNLVVKAAPHIMKSVKTIHGDGGPGTIRECTYTKESGCSAIVGTLRVDILDAKNFVYRHTITDGDAYRMMYSVIVEMRYEALGHDKCICKMSTEHHPKEGITYKEEDIEKGNRTMMALYKAMQDYLVANPNAYV
ncbi:major strawberry allergen Fra a 1.06-like [Punica granatum]|nr:major strawberry allergen Fra a 1.06-like [Punica granatum]OWM88118.1 hypothetical protein CDL15_Pgr016691 [Punica granatum]